MLLRKSHALELEAKSQWLTKVYKIIANNYDNLTNRRWFFLIKQISLSNSKKIDHLHKKH